MFAWFAIKSLIGKFLKNIPWKLIIFIALAAGLFMAGRHVVKTLSEQAALISVLSEENKRIVAANNDLERFYKTRLKALESSIKAKEQRDSDYEKAFDQIEQKTDSQCVINSPVIIESIRLRGQRRAKNGFNSD